jgi:hypothetical protein
MVERSRSALGGNTGEGDEAACRKLGTEGGVDLLVVGLLFQVPGGSNVLRWPLVWGALCWAISISAREAVGSQQLAA